MDIGKRIRNLRNKHNLTLEELASRTELTKGFLSQVERNLTSPSIVTLQDIIEALGVNLETFFKEDKNEKIVFKKCDYFTDEQDEYVINWIVPNAQKNEMEPIIIEINPNGSSKDIIPHEGEEFGYVLKGKITIVNLETKERFNLSTGETFYLKGDFAHRIENRTTTVSSVLWACTPPIF